MAKKKNKQIIRPWCWYCEREFEDEKVLMQHQKAKHFKCNMCPRRLNTAGGLAVHIQQVHKLEPENLPRIENALPGRDGYEVEIFGMEGIPAPDVADYKRRKEIELGLAAGSISQPPAKRPRTENRPMSEDELKAALEAHKALMGANSTDAPPPPPADQAVVYNAAPQTYATPPVPSVSPPALGPPGMLPPPGVVPPFMPPPGASPPPGQPGFPPYGFPPGPPPPGFPPGAFPPGPPPPGMVPPPGFLPPPGAVPVLPPGGRPPFPPPPTFVPQGSGSPFSLAGSPAPPFAASPPPPGVVHAVPQAAPLPPPPAPATSRQPAVKPTLPDPKLEQTNPPFKKPTDLKYKDANFSSDELRACNPKYLVDKSNASEDSRGKKRARAEDFL